MSIATQLFVALIGGLLAIAFAFGIVAPFVIANPQVIVPAAIGGALGFMIGSPLLVVKWNPSLLWDFLLALSLPPWVGIALGFAVGLIFF